MAIFDGNSYKGSGVAIGARWVLTAAHVVHGLNNVRVIAGTTNVAANEIQDENRYAAARIIEHHAAHPDLFREDFGVENGRQEEVFGHDLALIRVDRDLPAVIPMLGANDRARLTVNLPLMMTGWGDTMNGETTRLHAGFNEIMRIRQLTMDINEELLEDEEDEYMATIGEGDSGGPVFATFTDNEQDRTLMGIMVADDNDGHGTIVRVDANMQWIIQQTGIQPHRLGDNDDANRNLAAVEAGVARGVGVAAIARQAVHQARNLAREAVVDMEEVQVLLPQDVDEAKEDFEPMRDETGRPTQGGLRPRRQSLPIVESACKKLKKD